MDCRCHWPAPAPRLRACRLQGRCSGLLFIHKARLMSSYHPNTLVAVPVVRRHMACGTRTQKWSWQADGTVLHLQSRRLTYECTSLPLVPRA